MRAASARVSAAAASAAAAARPRGGRPSARAARRIARRRPPPRATTPGAARRRAPPRTRRRRADGRRYATAAASISRGPPNRRRPPARGVWPLWRPRSRDLRARLRRARRCSAGLRRSAHGARAANARIAAAAKMRLRLCALPCRTLATRPRDLARQAWRRCVQADAPTPRRVAARAVAALAAVGPRIGAGVAGAAGRAATSARGARLAAPRGGVAGLRGATAARTPAVARGSFFIRDGFSPRTPAGGALGRLRPLRHRRARGVQQHPADGPSRGEAPESSSPTRPRRPRRLGRAERALSTLQQDGLAQDAPRAIADRDGAIERAERFRRRRAAGAAGGRREAALAAAGVRAAPRERRTSTSGRAVGRIGAWGSSRGGASRSSRRGGGGGGGKPHLGGRRRVFEKVTTLREPHEKAQREGSPKTKRSTAADEARRRREVAYAPTDRALDAFGRWRRDVAARARRLDASAGVPRWHACFKRVEIERELQMFADFKIGDDAGAFRRRVAPPPRRAPAADALPPTAAAAVPPALARRRRGGDGRRRPRRAGRRADGRPLLVEGADRDGADAAEPATPLGDDAFEGSGRRDLRRGRWEERRRASVAARARRRCRRLGCAPKTALGRSANGSPAPAPLSSTGTPRRRAGGRFLWRRSPSAPQNVPSSHTAKGHCWDRWNSRNGERRHANHSPQRRSRRRASTARGAARRQGDRLLRTRRRRPAPRRVASAHRTELDVRPSAAARTRARRHRSGEDPSTRRGLASPRCTKAPPRGSSRRRLKSPARWRTLSSATPSMAEMADPRAWWSAMNSQRPAQGARAAQRGGGRQRLRPDVPAAERGGGPRRAAK